LRVSFFTGISQQVAIARIEFAYAVKFIWVFFSRLKAFAFLRNDV
jgi:hypothetical protein